MFNYTYKEGFLYSLTISGSDFDIHLRYSYLSYCFRWLKIGNVTYMTFVGFDVVAFGRGCYIILYNITTREEVMKIHTTRAVVWGLLPASDKPYLGPTSTGGLEGMEYTPANKGSGVNPLSIKFLNITY